MPTRRLAIAGIAILSSGGILVAQTTMHHPTNALTAKTDCRAGCQGSFNGCQESSRSAVFNASPGYHLDPTSRQTIGQQKGSPGLRSEPKWIIDRYPAGSETPTRVIVRPDLATCHGEHQHTQGITWYDIQMEQAPN
jgi:hypothetical protein